MKNLIWILILVVSLFTGMYMEMSGIKSPALFWFLGSASGIIIGAIAEHIK